MLLLCVRLLSHQSSLYIPSLYPLLNKVEYKELIVLCRLKLKNQPCSLILPLLVWLLDTNLALSPLVIKKVYWVLLPGDLILVLLPFPVRA